MPKLYDPNEINMAEEIVKSIWKKTHQCSLCRNRVVMNGFSAGVCQICGDAIICAETPCVKLCWKCARKNNKCIVCGSDLY